MRFEVTVFFWVWNEVLVFASMVLVDFLHVLTDESKWSTNTETGVLNSLKDANELKLVTHFLDAKDLLHLMQTKKEFHNTISGSFGKLFNHLDQEFTVNFGVYFVSEMPTNTAKLLSYFNMFCVLFGTEAPRDEKKDKAKEGFLSTLKTYLKRVILRRADVQTSTGTDLKRNKECTVIKFTQNRTQWNANKGQNR